VVQLPANGSRTRSPGAVRNLTRIPATGPDNVPGAVSFRLPCTVTGSSRWSRYFPIVITFPGLSRRTP
jgi:hypothetical protein